MKWIWGWEEWWRLEMSYLWTAVCQRIQLSISSQHSARKWESREDMGLRSIQSSSCFLWLVSVLLHPYLSSVLPLPSSRYLCSAVITLSGNLPPPPPPRSLLFAIFCLPQLVLCLSHLLLFLPHLLRLSFSSSPCPPLQHHCNWSDSPLLCTLSHHFFTSFPLLSLGPQTVTLWWNMPPISFIICLCFAFRGTQLS